MSYSHTRQKKERRKLWPDDWKAVSNKIRSGVFPEFFLKKSAVGSNKLERNKKGKLTWRQQSTLQALTDWPVLPPKKEVEVNAEDQTIRSVSSDPESSQGLS